MFLAGIGPPYIEWEVSFWFRGEHLPEFGLYALQLPWQELDGTDVHGLVSWIIPVCESFSNDVCQKDPKSVEHFA